MKEKLEKLVKYSNHIKLRMDSATPTKHLHREREFRAFLERELRMVTNKINSLKTT